MKIANRKKKAISPVLATVILIAITLIAAIAIAGFVFGLFGSFTNSATPQVSVVSVSASGTAAPFAATCQLTATAATGANLTVTNSGTGATVLTGVTFTYGGHTYTAALSGAACSLGASGSGTSTVYIDFTTLGGGTPSAGVAFTGTVSASNGGSASYAGTFSS